LEAEAADLQPQPARRRAAPTESRCSPQAKRASSESVIAATVEKAFGEVLERRQKKK
jgi:hypothetical protein